MTEPKDEQLLGLLARRNWLILVLLIVASLPWRSFEITAGVASGGLVAILGFGWLYLSLMRLIANPEGKAARRFKASYIIRLGALAATLFLLVAVAKVHPIALCIGLSVVVVNLFWTTVRSLHKS